MWQKQFNVKPAPSEPVYVVGDIHGRCDLLIRLISMIDTDIAERGLRNPCIIFVGDYIDRGPQSAFVISVMSELLADPNRNVVALRGNHEDMLLKFLTDPKSGPRWIKNGGYETLTSFGILSVTEESDEAALHDAAERLSTELGDNGIQFLKDLQLSHQSGNLFVAHAGADPTLPIDKQNPRDLVWGPQNLKKKTRKDKIWIAHGHYAESEPSVENGRISVDTGAYFSNQLTAARVLNDEIKFLIAEV